MEVRLESLGAFKHEYLSRLGVQPQMLQAGKDCGTRSQSCNRQLTVRWF